jgi:hypothetical protein
MKIIPRYSTRILVSTLVVLTGLVAPAKAWNNVGHRTIAELAWRQMDKDERGAATELLKQHPHYNAFLAADVPSGAETNEWVFLTAAIWPDWIRPSKPGQPHKDKSITKYDLYPHAIGYPFLRKGDTNRALIENFFIAKPNAEMVLSNSIATLKNSKATTADRAVSLCWMLHLFGDLHQPLHTASLVTKERPNGDSLGGHDIVQDQNGTQINLHSFWDRLPGVDPSYKAVAKLADELSVAPDLKTNELREYQEYKTIALWVQEGFQVAVNFAYSEDHVQFVNSADLESGKISTSKVPTLRADYLHEAKKIAHRRVVLAGQRLADELKQVW